MKIKQVEIILHDCCELAWLQSLQGLSNINGYCDIRNYNNNNKDKGENNEAETKTIIMKTKKTNYLGLVENNAEEQNIYKNDKNEGYCCFSEVFEFFNYVPNGDLIQSCLCSIINIIVENEHLLTLNAKVDEFSDHKKLILLLNSAFQTVKKCNCFADSMPFQYLLHQDYLLDEHQNLKQEFSDQADNYADQQLDQTEPDILVKSYESFQKNVKAFSGSAQLKDEGEQEKEEEVKTRYWNYLEEQIYNLAANLNADFKNEDECVKTPRNKKSNKKRHGGVGGFGFHNNNKNNKHKNKN